jgi:hypothetical protein
LIGGVAKSAVKSSVLVKMKVDVWRANDSSIAWVTATLRRVIDVAAGSQRAIVSFGCWHQ